MKKEISSSKTITYSAIIAALYIVLTLFSNVFGLASGVIQLRFSEALCILPCFFPTAIPGLFIGCFISNLITGAAIWDIFFGSFATLMGAIGTYYLRFNRWVAILPPIICNSIIIPFVLAFTYGAEQGFFVLVLTVSIGEILSVGVLGELLYSGIEKRRSFML